MSFKLSLSTKYFLLMSGLAVLLLISLLVISPPLNAATIKIGLRAILGVEKSMEQWKPTADYLSEKIPEHNFVIDPFVGLEELMQATEKKQFDFVFSNPSSYVEMESRFGASAILTLRNKRQGKPYIQFGSVIFTRKDSDINEIKDLQGKSIVGVSERAFGGWRVAVRELLKEGFDVKQKAMKISFSGGIQPDVVSIVELGNADAGVVRTDMLERLHQSGKINLDDFKIINKKKTKGFPFYHSTQLYPEWPFAKMPGTSTELSKKVALALLTIPSDHPAAIAGKYIGWTVPEDYQPVHNLMKELKVGPYLHFNKNPVEHFFDEYLIHIIIALSVFVILIFTSIYILSLNRKLYVIKNELEQRVEERTNDLLLAKKHAEAANMAKSEFLGNMSHELRTPLNATLGFAQIIKQESETEELAVINDYANEIVIAGRHLLELVNDVLDLTKIESKNHEMELKPLLVEDVILEVIQLLQPQAQEKQITLSFDIDDSHAIRVLADERSLKQVLINLVSNAIKYNHTNGTVYIEVENTGENLCAIKVTDDGDGIDENKLDLIFDPFQRMTNRTNTEGSGFGLSITKKLVEAMQGNIHVVSKLGHGSTFSVVLKQVV